MVKILMFDLKESEKKFFYKNNVSDFDISFYKESLNETTKLTVSECDETSIISVLNQSMINKTVLDKFKNLRLIAVRSTGYENIDINICRQRNIGVVNINDCKDNSIAQYVLGMIFMLSRNIIRSINDFTNKQNRYDKYEGRDISKLTLGVIGTGTEGCSVCKLADKIGMKIYAYDLSVNSEIADIVEYVSILDLLRLSDVITIHLPFNKDLYHFLSDSEFEIMKERALLINTSHPEFIDTRALYKAITQRKIFGAVLDMIECENKYYDLKDKSEDLQENCAEILLLIQEMVKNPNVIITPRIAHNTEDSVEEVLQITFNSIKDFYKGGHLNRVV